LDQTPWDFSKMISKQKGQVNIYFLVSIALFISLSVYLVYLLISFYPAKGETIRINSLYTKSYTLSELMLKDPGYPESWNDHNLERMGLASEYYVINSTKLDYLRIMCDPLNPSSRNRLYNASGLTNEFLMVTITYLNGTSVLNCAPSGETELNTEYLRKRTAEISRIATLNHSIVQVNIYVG
jgi:hypothetical protein